MSIRQTVYIDGKSDMGLHTRKIKSYELKVKSRREPLDGPQSKVEVHNMLSQLRDIWEIVFRQKLIPKD